MSNVTAAARVRCALTCLQHVAADGGFSLRIRLAKSSSSVPVRATAMSKHERARAREAEAWGNKNKTAGTEAAKHEGNSMLWNPPLPVARERWDPGSY